MSEVPQGSVLGSFPFNIFVNDFIFAMKSSMRLMHDISRALDFFKDNKMVANPKKFEVMFFGQKQHQEFILEIEKKSIIVTRSVKLLGTKVDDELKFHEHAKTLCQKVMRKVSALSKVTPYINDKKGKVLYHTFVMSNFSHCPLIWMFCRRTANDFSALQLLCLAMKDGPEHIRRLSDTLSKVHLLWPCANF